MKPILFSAVLMAVLIAAPLFAQPAPTTTTTEQKTDGEGPTPVGPASGAYAADATKQKTDGEGPTPVGPASGAYKQKTQSLSHSDPDEVTKK